MPKYLIVSLFAALLAFGGCGTKRDDSGAEGSAAASKEKRATKAARQAKKRAEDEARAKEAIAKLQTADEPALIAALGDQDRRVRRAAIQLLSDKGANSEVVIQAALPLLADHWKPTRQAARQLLIHIGEPAVAPLVKSLGNDSAHGNLSFPVSKKGRKPITFRTAVKDALAEMGEVALPALTAALANEDPFIRRNAIGTLGRMGEKASPAVPALLQAHEKQGRRRRGQAPAGDGDEGAGSRREGQGRKERHRRGRERARRQAVTHPRRPDHRKDRTPSTNSCQEEKGRLPDLEASWSPAMRSASSSWASRASGSS